MNVFSTDPALEALAAGLGAGAARPLGVGVDGLVFRTIEVGGRPVLSHPLIDFLEPDPALAPARSERFVPRIARRTVTAAEWPATQRPEIEPAPFVDWSGFTTWKDYERFVMDRRSNLWSDTRRRSRKLAGELGDVVFEADDRGDEAWERCLEWKVDQYVRTGAPDHLSDGSGRRYLDGLRGAGLTRVSTVRAGTTLVASHIGLHHEGRWYYWFPSFDPEYQPVSPGRVLLHEMLRASHAAGDREFDFLFGDESYKWYYATDARIVEPFGSPGPLDRARLLRKSLPRRYPQVQKYGQTAVRTLRRWRAQISS